MLKIVIPILPRSKKNNQKIIKNKKNNKLMIIPSEEYKQYEADCAYFLKRYELCIDYAINLKCTFYLPDNRKRDLTNYLEAVQDILVKYKIIKDDCWKIVYSVDGSRIKIDKENPRVEIEITKI